MDDINFKEIKKIYFELAIINFNLDDPHYYCNEDTKKGLNNVLTNLEKLLKLRDEDE